MYLAESETLATRLSDIRHLVEQVDARLAGVDPNGVLRPGIWASTVGASSAVVERVFDEYAKLGMLQLQIRLECKCGNLRLPAKAVSTCSGCQMELPDPDTETEVRVYTISSSAQVQLLRIQETKSRLSRSRLAKILVVSANPEDATFLRTDKEYRELLEATGADGEVKVEFAVRFAKLQELLLKHRPDVLHLSLHGIKDDALVFESDEGRSERVSHADFLEVLSFFREHLLCVVLSSCHSQKLGENLKDIVPIVVAMQRAVGDTAAIMFAKSYYHALVGGSSFAQAFGYAVLAMKTNLVGDEDIPTLLVQRGVDAKNAFLNRK